MILWRSLGLLTRKVGQARVEFLVESLSDKLVAGKKEQDRDIASIGLKTVVAEASGGQLAQVLVKKVTPKMVEGLKSTVGLHSPAKRTKSINLDPDLN